MIILAVLAAAVAVWAALLDTSASVGPGRVELAVLVVAWAATAVVLVRQRPDEPLGLLVAAGAVLGAIAVLGATAWGRAAIAESTRDAAAAARAFGLTAVLAVALHAALGLPDGRLTSTGRRVVVAFGYAASLAVGAVVYADRPEFTLDAVARARRV